MSEAEMMRGNKEGEIHIARHADKGAWTINAEELKGRLSDDEVRLVLTVLRDEFPDLKETPLRLDGIVRSLHMGDMMFESLPDKSVLVGADSGKPRAQLTRALAMARIAQREAQYNDEHGEGTKCIDMLQVDEEAIRKLIEDSSDATWDPYAKMIKDEGISELEAIARWLRDMNKPGSSIDPAVHPKESAERYRTVIGRLRAMVTSEQVPVSIFGVGHSGPLGQIRYEKQKGQFVVGDVPQFSELFQFGNGGQLLETKQIAL